MAILNQFGEPLKKAAKIPAQPRPQALNGGMFSAPYDASDVFGSHVQNWHPYLGSPDTELNPYRDRIVARARDLVRNDGWANGAVTRVLDNAVGATYRPVSKPDFRALAAFTGNAAFDSVWADEYGRAVDARWRVWADDPGRYCDTGRKMNFRQIARVAFRHEIIDGDSLAVLMWMPGRVGPGRAHYATSVRLVDPDRLSNPNNAFDLLNIRGGVEIDDDGSPIAYHIRKAHPGDYYNAAGSLTWEKIAREDEFGRPRVVHNFTSDRADQHRGGAGMLTPIIQRLKMLIKYDGVELDAAILNAVFGAYVESPMDPQLVTEAMGGGAGIDGAEFLGTYQEQRAIHHRDRQIKAGGVQMPIMFPGEKIQTVTAARPNSNFSDFENAFLRNFAAGTGLATQQISNNWSDTNYSSFRGAMLEARKTLDRRNVDFADGFAQPVRVAVLEEMHEKDRLPMPKSGEVPEFMEMRGAYSRCRWMVPAQGWVDPVKEKQGAILGLEAGLSTLEDEAAAQGRDWEDDLDQRAIELARYKDKGVPLPQWSVDPATITDDKEENKKKSNNDD